MIVIDAKAGKQISLGRIGQSDPRFWMMPAEPHVYTKIVIKKVTGKGAYRLYGKRKV